MDEPTPFHQPDLAAISRHHLKNQLAYLGLSADNPVYRPKNTTHLGMSASVKKVLN
jgi:hypothetical protein